MGEFVQVQGGVEFGFEDVFDALAVQGVDDAVGQHAGGVDDRTQRVRGGDGRKHRGQLVAVGDVGGGEVHRQPTSANSVRSSLAPSARGPERLTSSRWPQWCVVARCRARAMPRVPVPPVIKMVAVRVKRWGGLGVGGGSGGASQAGRQDHAVADGQSRFGQRECAAGIACSELGGHRGRCG